MFSPNQKTSVSCMFTDAKFYCCARETTSGLVKQRGIYWDAVMELPEVSKTGETDLENNCHSVVTMMARKWEWPEHSDHTGNKKPQAFPVFFPLLQSPIPERSQVTVGDGP